MRKTSADYAQQSDPTRNRHFRRRWSDTPVLSTHTTSPERIRLIQLPAALNADGEPRAMLEVPAQPGAVSRRPNVLTFATISEAIAAKRVLEAGR